MQTLWTRVAQVRASCHCPQCVSSISTSAVARRAAATATRRAPRFWTTSTVWYSGIFAVAATLDLGIKQQRREQWNRAIADVKEELTRSDDAANREFLDSLEEETVATAEMRDNLDSSAFRPIVPEWPVSMGQDLLSNKLPPQSIYTDNRRKARHMLDRWSPKKLERVQLCIDAMQLEFFVELHRRGWHEEAANAVPAWYAEHILRPVEETRSMLITKHRDLDSVYHMKGKYSFGPGENAEAAAAEFDRWQRSEGDMPLCNYRQDEMGEFHRTAHDLNTTLRNLFEMGRKRELSQAAVLAKVYHNLSVSFAPPNIDTFSTLIVGLSDFGTRRLVEDCINSMYCSHMRHNEVSLASILNYYTLTGNQEKFQYWVQLMRGQWGGLSLAQPGVDISESSQGRLFQKRETSARVIQRPSPTPMVFGALVNGVIKFNGLQAALNVCEAARHEGWGLCIKGLRPLLKDCSRRKDWAAGHATWKQIQALRAARLIKYDRDLVDVDLPTYATMLQLCTRCNNRTAFQDIMEQAVRTYPEAARHLIRMVKAERAEMQTSDRALKDESVAKLTPLSDIANWLGKQNLHEYTGKLKAMRWQDMVRLDDAGLKAKGVASELARKKLLQIFEQVCVADPLEDDTAESSWLPIAEEQRHRQRVKEQLMKRQEWERKPDGTLSKEQEALWSQPRTRGLWRRVEVDYEGDGEYEWHSIHPPSSPECRQDVLSQAQPASETQHTQASTADDDVPQELKLQTSNLVNLDLPQGQLKATY